MNKLFICVFLLSSAINGLMAQKYKEFRVIFSLGNAVPNYDGYVNVVLTVEPSYRLNDEVALGFRWERLNREDFFSSDKVSNSFTCNGQYYFSATKFRPFAGVGLGIYSYIDNDVPANFGGYPRLGFDWGHLTICMDYNFIILKETNYWEYIRSSYLDIRMGFFLGGGRD